MTTDSRGVGTGEGEGVTMGSGERDGSGVGSGSIFGSTVKVVMAPIRQLPFTLRMDSR